MQVAGMPDTGTNNPTEKKFINCAIYTRKSHEEGLEQEFNSLDAQREAAEAYIESQRLQGWRALPDRYDDGGFSGGNMERPGLQRLLADVDAGKVDVIVVYKIDRLSRSLLDFMKMIERFNQTGVSFVSVTQHFNTTDPTGRMFLGILITFAQYEREVIAERIRDKVAAAKRRGKYCGGPAILGYDVDRERQEAARQSGGSAARQAHLPALHPTGLGQGAGRGAQRAGIPHQVLDHEEGKTPAGEPLEYRPHLPPAGQPHLHGRGGPQREGLSRRA